MKCDDLLDISNFKMEQDLVNPWSKHHAAQKRSMVDTTGLNPILPLIDKPVHTLETQFHCMTIIKRTVEYLNPGQTAIDVCDQPVYALRKEIQ